jgi:RNA-directed DNA polymerase
VDLCGGRSATAVPTAKTRKDGATGIDGVTAQDYEANLEANLRDLLERIKSGSYEPPPVRRTYIPKADGSQRPIGIPTVHA